MGRFVVFLIVIILACGGGYLWWADSVGPVDKDATVPVTFSVKDGDGVRSIAANLKEQHLIKSPTAFFILVKLMGIEHGLQKGDFRLAKSMDMTTIAKELMHGYNDIRITLLEGWRNEEIASLLSKDLDVPESEFAKVAREGYMFPDTYAVPKDASAAAVAAILLDNFNAKVTPQMRSAAKAKGLSLSDLVTLASLVEREGRTETDKPIIAGVLLNRLKAGWPLQVDATLQFALGYQTSEKSWWKKELTDADRSVASPYNTYKNTGLPPGPICNPGLVSINAVINASATEYWYYIHDPSGAAHFAKTIEEQNANIAKYLQ